MEENYEDMELGKPLFEKNTQQYETIDIEEDVQFHKTSTDVDSKRYFEVVTPEFKDFQDMTVQDDMKNNQCVGNKNRRSQEIAKTNASADKRMPVYTTNEVQECTFSQVGCKFQSSIESSLEAHLQKEIVTHLDLVLKTTLKLAKWQASELRKQTSMYETLLAFCHKHVQLEQKNRALELRLNTLQRKVDENCIPEFRPSSGSFYWRVCDFSKLVTDAIFRSGRNIYSKNFSTKTDGYCLCLRMALRPTLNLSDVEVGLFIHFVKGDYDDYLVWPFGGKIKLSIMDQNEKPKLRVHIVEHATADAKLQAFQRAMGHERNPHGFGYKEFVTTCILQSGTYIRDDTLLIKCEVKSE